MNPKSPSQSATAAPPRARTVITRREWNLLLAILAGFAALAFWYSMATPPFETPDEVYHYAFVRHVAAGNGLPVQQAAVEGPWEQEGSQAPLYYLLVGALTSGIEQDDFAQLSVQNPRANIGNPLYPGNKNFMLYSAAAHPLQGANLALHVGRWVSLLLGLITLCCTYFTARIAFPMGWLALAATLWVAAIPQFAFISASCSNDSLIIATSAATVYWVARLATKAPTAAIPRREWVVLGILLGLAALSKLQGLGLIGLAGLVILWLARQRRDWRLVLTALLPVALPALLLAGWWYGRNLWLYGDLFGISHLLANNGLRTEALTLRGLWGELRGLRYSFWGLFGWFNLLLPHWIYWILDTITVAALLGLLARLFVSQRDNGQRASSIIRGIAWLWLLLSLLLLAYWISQATGSQGRLLFPAIGVIILLGIDGWQFWLGWLPPRLQRLGWLLPPGLLVGSSIFALTMIYPQVYAAPLPLATVPPTATAVEITYRGQPAPTGVAAHEPVDARVNERVDELRVLALDSPSGRYQPGQTVPITLYLQAREPVRSDYQLFIQLLNEERVEIGNLTSHPGWGRHPTSLWQPGAIYADPYQVRIEQPIDNRSPLLATLYVGFVNPATEKSGRLPIAAYDGTGNVIKEPFLGTVAISPATQPTVTEIRQQNPMLEFVEVGTQFGGLIQLTAVLLPPDLMSPDLSTGDGTIPVHLIWDALGTPAGEYTMFVHFIDRNGERLTGFDQAPAPRFPTQHWQAGDRIVTELALSLPMATAQQTSTAYTVWVGLYAANSGGADRLPVTDAAGRVAGDGQVLVQE